MQPEENIISIDLTEQFFSNLNWSLTVDSLHEMPSQNQHNYLGFRTACSDVIWRFYKKQVEERIQLRKLQESRMKVIEKAVTKTLSN